MHCLCCLCCRPQWAIYTAVYLCHHYYAKRSFQRSDKYVSVLACADSLHAARMLHVDASAAASLMCAPGPKHSGTGRLIIELHIPSQGAHMSHVCMPGP